MAATSHRIRRALGATPPGARREAAPARSVCARAGSGLAALQAVADDSVAVRRLRSLAADAAAGRGRAAMSAGAAASRLAALQAAADSGPAVRRVRAPGARTAPHPGHGTVQMAGGWSDWLPGLATVAGGAGLIGGLLTGASPLALAAAGALGVGGLVGLFRRGAPPRDRPETRPETHPETRSETPPETRPGDRPRDPAETRIARAVDRSTRRRARGRLGTGYFTTQTGELTFSEFWGQIMSRTSREFYGGESLGSLPAYGGVRRGVTKETAPALYGEDVDASNLPDASRLAVTLGVGLANVSEEDREPGAGKFIRALARRYAGDPDAHHPFDEGVNPSVGRGGAARMRKLLGGETELSDYQRETYDAYASDSSGSEDDYYARRTNLVRRSDIRK